MPDSDGPDLVDPHPNVPADVQSGSVTDDGQAGGSAAPEDAVEELRAVAGELREERERLEWTANQVAHLVEHRSGPSLDPDPTPPAPINLQAVTPASENGQAQEAAAGEAEPDPPLVSATGEPVVDGRGDTDPDGLAGSSRRGGSLVTVLGVLMLLLAAAVLVSRVLA